ncbi:MAG: hypothetical protein WC114_11070 [Smithellaceae bacterium]|jgi:hypothetical protein
MGILRRLLDFLPTYFDIDPQKAAGFEIKYDAGAIPIRYSVEDNRIFASVLGGMSKDFEISLSGKTIQTVMDEIDAVAHYTTVLLGNVASKSAICLVDVEDSLDPTVSVFCSPLWAVLKAAALELDEAKAAGDELLRQLSIPGSTGILLNYWAEYFGEDRRTDELDNVFGQRVIDTVRQPKSNNTAMGIILRSRYGYYIQVHDSSNSLASNLFLMNNLATPFHDYDFPIYLGSAFGAGAAIVCLIFPTGTISQWTLSQFAELQELVGKIRAAGVQPKVFWPDAPVFTPEEIPYTIDGPFYTHDLF